MKQLELNGLTLTEVYCGGGLGAVGMTLAGYKIVKAYDFNAQAITAYKKNLGDHAEQADLSTKDPHEFPDTDGLFGGPPCQDYSLAGSGKGEEGERGKLVWQYKDTLRIKQPKFFVFENVKGLISKKHRHTFDKLIAEFEALGYNVSWKLVNAWDFGVAQKRERVFIVGIRQDLGFTFEFPEPDPSEYRTKTLRNAIGDLPAPEQ